MLSRKFRLTKNKDFEKVWQRGRSFFLKEIGIKFSANHLECSRFGVIVPNKAIKDAVPRNKVKRRIREIIRKRENFIKNGFDLVVLARIGVKELSFKDLEERIDFILRKLGLLKS